MPGAYARTATQALTNATYKYIESLADHGLVESCRRLPGLKSGISVLNKCLTSRPVAEAHGLAFTALEAVPAGNFEI